MKNTRRTILTAAVATALLAPLAVSAAHAEEPVQAITAPHSIDIAITNAGYERNGTIYSTNGVPFATLSNGQTFVGDDTDHAWTRTWIPWSGQTVTVAPYDHSLTPTTPVPGSLHVRGGILSKYMSTGGETRHGQPTVNEYNGTAGTHAGATPTATQAFQTGGGRNTEIVWTKAYSARVVTGGILSAWKNHGGANHQGAPTTDEYTTWVNGTQYQEQRFERGTFRWSPGTGAFRVG